MIPRLSKAEKLLALSIGFTLILLTARIIYTSQLTYLFYPWNIFLALVPLYFSNRLNGFNKLNAKSIALLAVWLLFFPNAPYIITDIFHFYKRPGVPQWYDLVLVLCAAWVGMAAGFISLLQVEGFVKRCTGKSMNVFITAALLFAASVGIYIGRYLRLNSWDVVAKPGRLARFAFQYTFHPVGQIKAWAFTLVCTMLLVLIYNGIKSMAGIATQQQPT
jgi:uncharacterized membrane protein